MSEKESGFTNHLSRRTMGWRKDSEKKVSKNPAGTQRKTLLDFNLVKLVETFPLIWILIEDSSINFTSGLRPELQRQQQPLQSTMIDEPM